MASPTSSVASPWGFVEVADTRMRVASVSVVAGFGKYMEADLVVHPDAGISAVAFDGILKQLAEKHGDFGTESKATITMNDGTGGTSLVLEGRAAGLGYKASDGASPGYALHVVGEASDMAALGLGIYNLDPHVLDKGKAQYRVPRAFTNADTLGTAVAAVVDALIATFPDSSSSKSIPTTGDALVRESLHSRNKLAVRHLMAALNTMNTAGGPNWLDTLKGADRSNLFGQIYNYLTLRVTDFTTNLSTLCSLFGMTWHSSFSGQAVTVRSLEALGDPDFIGKHQAKTAPKIFRNPAPLYTTPTGRKPTHTVVEMKSSGGLMAISPKTSGILAVWPDSPLPDGTSVLHRLKAPPWFPDTRVVHAPSFPGSSPADPKNAATTAASVEGRKDVLSSSVAVLGRDWARVGHARVLGLARMASVVMPADFSIEPGTYVAIGKKDGSVLTGLVWSATHSLETSTRSGRAETSLDLRYIETTDAKA